MNNKQKAIKELKNKLDGLINIVEIDNISGEKIDNRTKFARLAQFEINEIMAKIKEIAISQEMA